MARGKPDLHADGTGWGLQGRIGTPRLIPRGGTATLLLARPGPHGAARGWIATREKAAIKPPAPATQTADDAFAACCHQLCGHIDWAAPLVAQTAIEAAHSRGDAPRAARLFIRALRERAAPRWIFTPEYARQVRDRATPAYREKAETALRALTPDGKDGGYGRVACLNFLPAEHFLAAATPELFADLTQRLLDQRAHWGQWGCQTLFRWFETIQATWPMADCPDDFFVPALCWLLDEARNVWTFTQTWTEAMLGTSGHNWWAFELCALWKVGFYFPECLDTAKFRVLYPTYVEREMTLSLGRDGYSEEQSVSYHWSLDGILAGTLRIAELNGLPITKSLARHREACARLPYRLVAPDGTAPSFGDHGGGAILDRVVEAAAWFGLPEAKYVAEHLSPPTEPALRGLRVVPRNMGWTGRDLGPAYDAVRPAAPPLDTALPAAGLYAMRSSWEPDAHYLCIEACPRGAIATSHGHTTLMNFVAHSHGTPVLIDSSAGWETDTSGVWWRTGSFSHNVATVDGEHHLPIRSIFRWDQAVTPVVEGWASTPTYSYFSGVHEAYERLPHRVSATRRKLFSVRGGYWILIDRFTAAGKEDPHTYTQHFQLALPCTLADDGTLATTGDAGNLLIVPAPVAEVTPKLEACPHPQDHYPNPEHLTYTVTTTGSGLLATVLVPFLGTPPPPVTVRVLPVETKDRALSSWEATGLEITIGDRRDVYVDVHTHWNQAWRCGGHAGDARLFHSACHAEG